MFEVNPFHIVEIHSPLCLRHQLWTNWNFKTKGGHQRDILNLKWKTMKSLPVCLDLYMSQCVSFFFFIILLKL